MKDLWIDSHDASRGKLRESVQVFVADFSVKKSSLGESHQVRSAPGKGHREKLAEGRDWREISLPRSLGNPGNPGGGIIDGCVQQRGAFSRKQELKPGNVIKCDPEDGQPIGQPVTRDVAQSKHLVEGGKERRLGDAVVEIVGNVEPGGVAKNFGRIPRHAVQRQASAREDTPNSLR